MSPEDSQNIRKQLVWAMFVIGTTSVVLNFIVIVRILRTGVKKVPRGKLYFLSLAVADMLFSFGVIAHWLLTRGYINVKTDTEKRIAINWWRANQGLSFVSNLFHIIVITIDRFLATKYPIKYRTSANQRNAVMVIALIWTISALISSTQFWASLLIIDWIVNIGIAFGSLICVVTYMHIGRILYKRKLALNKLSGTSQINTSSRSLNTTRIGVSIAVAFIIFNLPFCIASIIQGQKWDKVVSTVMYTSLSINCMIDPIVYNIMDFIHMKRMNKTHSNHNIELVHVQKEKRLVFVIPTTHGGDAV